jgi:hypothetical protein
MESQEIDQQNSKDKQIEEELLNSDALFLDDKVNIFLTAKGVKPASEIHRAYESEFEDTSPREAYEKEVAQIRATVQGLGVPTEEVVDEVFPGEEVTRFLIGKDDEHLRRLIASYTRGYIVNTRLFGLAVGYPETAVNAYENDPFHRKEGISIEELPEEVRNSDWIKFLSFGLSRSNWREELSQVKRYAETIQLFAPKLYKEVLSKK